MKCFEKLRQKIKAELDIEAGNFKRRRISKYQKQAGYWEWCATKIIDNQFTGFDIGSCWTAGELVRYRGKLSITKAGEIIPD